MASIGFMVGTALVNALAFTGENFIFSLANQYGSMDKVKRHNKTMDELNKKRDEWTKQQRELSKTDQKSVGDFKDVSYAAELYHTMTEEQEQQGQKVQQVGVVGEQSSYPIIINLVKSKGHMNICLSFWVWVLVFFASSFFHTSKWVNRENI